MVEIREISLKALIPFTLFILLNPAILFLSAGTLKWGMAWVYTAVTVIQL